MGQKFTRHEAAEVTSGNSFTEVDFDFIAGEAVIVNSGTEDIIVRLSGGGYTGPELIVQSDEVQELALNFEKFEYKSRSADTPSTFRYIISEET